jgi:pilus assembly protein CpaE
LGSVGRVERAESLAHAVEILAFSAADCLIVDVPPDRHTRAVLGRISAAYPDTRILVLAQALPFDIARELVRLGVRDVLPLPLDPAACTAAVREVLADRDSGVSGLRGMAIAVTSGKGGTGCTAIAVHLAAALASYGVAAVLDGDAPPFGTVAAAADLDTGSSIAGLVRQRLPIEPRVLRRAAIQHPAGFSILPLWTTPSDPPEIEDSIAAALDALAAIYPFVVMDIGRPILPAQRLLLRRATVVVAVATLDLLALRNLRQAADLAAAETGGGLRLLTVLNRCDREESYTPDQAAAAFGQPFMAVLPYAPALRACLDRGELMQPAEPEPEWYSVLTGLAEEIVARRREDVRGAVAPPAV